jgi:dipeptidyl aminopeptidase/acylaminoacyl peptidase
MNYSSCKRSDRRTVGTVVIAVVATLFAAMSVTSRAQTTAPRGAAAKLPTVEDFFRHSKFANATLSPSGQFLAALAPVNGRLNLVVVDLKGKSSVAVTAFQNNDVANVRWVNNKRLVYSTIDLKAGLGEQRGGGFYAIDRDGQAPREITPSYAKLIESGIRVLRYTTMLSRVGDDSDEIFAETNERSSKFTDVYRLNTRTGAKQLLTFDAPGGVTTWVVDRDGVPRAAVQIEKAESFRLWVRPTATAPWKSVHQSSLKDGDGVKPLAFDWAGDLYVSARAKGEDKAAIYKLVLDTGALGEKIASDPFYDITDGLIFDVVQKKLVGVAVDGDKPNFIWLDQQWARWHGTLEATLPNRVNRLSRTTDSSSLLVVSSSDRVAAESFLFDPVNRKLEELGAALPWMNAASLGERVFMRYESRDGTSIPAYVTYPPNVERSNLPLVLYVHGGPWVRGDEWNFDRMAQFLATRGYAVLQPNFRGTEGNGWRHFRSSWKQWGLTMQDDLADGVQHLIRKGIVDGKRVCIMGASYGGYATMMGLVKDPDLYKCGINYVGVTDPMLLHTVTWSDTADTDWARYRMADMVGDPDKDKELLSRASPLQRATEIKAPILMAYGGEDYRVPLVHGERMKTALDARGVPVEWVVYREEGHGWLKEENQYDFARRVEKFLAKHIGK